MYCVDRIEVKGGGRRGRVDDAGRNIWWKKFWEACLVRLPCCLSYTDDSRGYCVISNYLFVVLPLLFVADVLALIYLPFQLYSVLFVYLHELKKSINFARDVYISCLFTGRTSGRTRVFSLARQLNFLSYESNKCRNTPPLLPFKTII